MLYNVGTINSPVLSDYSAFRVVNRTRVFAIIYCFRIEWATQFEQFRFLQKRTECSSLFTPYLLPYAHVPNAFDVSIFLAYLCSNIYSIPDYIYYGVVFFADFESKNWVGQDVDEAPVQQCKQDYRWRGRRRRRRRRSIILNKKLKTTINIIHRVIVTSPMSVRDTTYYWKN